MQIARNHTGHRVGETHGKAKLTDAQVREMRKLHSQGIGYRRLAKRFGCGISTVRDIVLYRTRWSA
jgi:transposase